MQQVGVRGHRRGAGDLALGIELEQLARHVAHPLLHPRLGAVPRGAAELVEARRHAFDAAELLHLVDARQRQQQPLAAGVGDLHHLGLDGGAGAAELAQHRRQAARAQAVAAHRAQGHELADAVVDVHHVIAHLEIAQAGEEGTEAGLAPPAWSFAWGRSCCSP